MPVAMKPVPKATRVLLVQPVPSSPPLAMTI
jgi:hypothetical protein